MSGKINQTETVPAGTIEAIKALVDILPKVGEASSSIFAFASVHNVYYNGPTWEKELAEVKRILGPQMDKV